MKTIVLASAVSFLALGMAGAATASTEVELKDVAARVVVTPENRTDVDLKVAYGKAQLPQIMVHTVGSKLVADGKLKGKHLQCKGGNAVSVDGVGTVASSDLPTIYIKVPLNASVSAGGATFGQLGAS